MIGVAAGGDGGGADARGGTAAAAGRQGHGRAERDAVHQERDGPCGRGQADPYGGHHRGEGLGLAVSRIGDRRRQGRGRRRVVEDGLELEVGPAVDGIELQAPAQARDIDRREGAAEGAAGDDLEGVAGGGREPADQVDVECAGQAHGAGGVELVVAASRGRPAEVGVEGPAAVLGVVPLDLERPGGAGTPGIELAGVVEDVALDLAGARERAAVDRQGAGGRDQRAVDGRRACRLGVRLGRREGRSRSDGERPRVAEGRVGRRERRPFWTVKLPIEVTEVRPASAFWLLVLMICELVPSSVTEAARVLMALVVPGTWSVPETEYVPPVRVVPDRFENEPCTENVPAWTWMVPGFENETPSKIVAVPEPVFVTVPLLVNVPLPPPNGWNETLSPWNSRLPVDVLMNGGILDEIDSRG